VALTFRVLGSLQVTQPGTPVHLNSPAQRKILAALLVHPGTVASIDHLIDVLWGDAPPATAPESVRTHIYRLRSLLHRDGQEYLHTRQPGYVLAVDPDAIDARCFEHLVAEARVASPEHPQAAASLLGDALALWRGSAFAEFSDEPFAHAEATRLEELRLATREDLLAAKLDLGRHAEVVGEAEALVKEQPLRERAHEQLMLARYRCGQQSQALDAYRRLREHLGSELGLEPSPRLQGLETAILQQSPELDWVPPPPDTKVAHGGGLTEASGPEPPALPRGWLPHERTSFVGRGREMAAVADALREHQVVCLVGAGGVGKSRLALRAARHLAAEYPDGVWWCDLASVTGAEAVADALAATLGVSHPSGDPVDDSICEALVAARALLVVDNCEHVAAETSRLLELVTERCRHVQALATSRVALDVPLARPWTVNPLPVFASDEGDVAEAPAVELFVERARAARPELSPGPEELDQIAELCRRLDGLPLAIELAAARIRSLNPTDILERLGDRFGLLAGRRVTTSRHRTLQDVVDWSFDLLSWTEQRLFERLSVFAGAFTPAAAEQVCSGDPVAQDEIVDLLDRLVDASMVTVGSPEGEVSYRLLETLRHFGHARLAVTGELAHRQRAHADYYARMAEEAHDGVRGPDEARWVARLDRDLPNLREAHRWAMATHDIDIALRLSTALFRYGLWRLRDEVMRWAEAAVDLPGADQHHLWPRACGVAGWGCGLRGQRIRALDFAERGLAVANDDDPGRIALAEVQAHIALWEGRLDDCIAVMGHAAGVVRDPRELMPWTVRSLALAYAGHTDEATETARRAQADADRVGNPSMMALARYSLGEALLERDPDAAASVFDHAIELAGPVHNRMVLGVAGVSTTSLRARHGDPDTALRSCASVLDVWAQTSDWTHLWVGLRSIAELFARVGADEAAAVLLGTILDSEIGPPAYGTDVDRLDRLATDLAARLGERQFAGARSRGRVMAAAEILDFTRHSIDRLVAASDDQDERRPAATPVTPGRR
jgi:predicted ATPase/DNA-binding SARP family transcriptional activator